MSMLLKCSAVVVLLCLYYGTELQVDGKPVDVYDEIIGTDDKLFIQMLELIDSIGSDDSDDESSGSRYQSDENRTSYRSNSEKCLLPRRKGVCRALIPRWSYDPISKECKEFKFGGCDGNGNNFSTEKSCMEACKGMWKMWMLKTRRERSLRESPVNRWADGYDNLIPSREYY